MSLSSVPSGKLPILKCTALIEFPSQEAVADALSRRWGIAPEAVSPWKSPRIFRIEGYGIARIGFPRAGLTSVQLVELVDRLHAAGCPVPAIVPTSDGDLSIALGQKTLSWNRNCPVMDVPVQI
jgi:hypothetical protein